MPQVPAKKTGKSVAVVGSGPAGMACAQQLARAGHSVTVFEKNDRIGGLLRYGIPDFKMEKHLINRRCQQMEAEGVTFKTSNEVGVEVSFQSLRENFDAVVLSGGAEDARPLEIPGAEMPGVRLAMEFLTQQNKRNAGDDELRAAPRGSLLATGKHVIVIGGGDTGSDCVGTSNRQGAKSVTQLEIMPKPPEKEDKALTWPDWPLKLRTSSSHQEGVERDWAVLTKRVIGDGEAVTGPRMRPRRVGRWPDAGNDGQRIRDPGRSDPAGDGLCRADQGRLARTGGRHAVGARQCRCRHRTLRHQRTRRVRLRRHAARAEPGRLGDPRRAAMRAERRRGADGGYRTAALRGGISVHDR